jgi:hypothetical protein
MQGNDPEFVQGPYQAPALRRGDRTTCIYRDAEVVITSWTDARISWPRCQRVGIRGGSGVLVDEELLRAIRNESSAALQYWFGVSEFTVWNWRKKFGVARWGTEGSRRLHQQVSEAGADEVRGKKRPLAAIQKQIQTCRERAHKQPQ